MTADTQFETIGNTCAFLGAQTAIDDNVSNVLRHYKNYGLKFSGTGRVYAGSLALPAAPQSAVQGAAGTVPLGVHAYGFQAVDNDGIQTPLGPTINYTATDSAHTAVITAPATFPAGTVGLDLYRDGNLVNATGIPVGGGVFVHVAVPGGTVIDLTNFGGGLNNVLVNKTGQQSMSPNGINSNRYVLNAESMTAVPRAEQNVFLPGALTTTWTGSSWVLDKAVTVTRVQVQAKTAPATCAPNAIVRVTDGTTPINVTVAAGGNDSGALTQNYAAGATITTSVQTAAAGCGTSPADANVTIQYRMQ